MPKQTVLFASKTFKSVAGCASVAICLADADDSANGLGIVFGTVENTGRPLTDVKGVPTQNPRAVDLYQYSLTVDNTQLAEDVVLVCASITDFSTEPCFWTKIIAAVEALS